MSGIGWYLNGKHYVLFGSINKQEDTYISNELWEYNPETEMWAWISGNLIEEKQINYTFPAFGINYQSVNTYIITDTPYQNYYAQPRVSPSIWIKDSVIYFYGGATNSPGM